MNHQELAGRAFNYELLLKAVWDCIGAQVLIARSAEEIRQVLQSLDSYYRPKLAFDPMPEVIFQALQDREFPKSGRPNKVIPYLARSIAGEGIVSPRYSRRICHKESQKLVSP